MRRPAPTGATLALAATVACLAVAPVIADDVELTHGQVFEGVDVRLEGDRAILDLGFGRIILPRHRIRRIVATAIGAEDWRPRPASPRPVERRAEPGGEAAAEPWREAAYLLAGALARRDTHLDRALAIIEEQMRRPQPPPPAPYPWAGTVLAVGPGYMSGSAPGDRDDPDRPTTLPAFAVPPLSARPALGPAGTWSQLSRRQPGSLIPLDRF